MERLERAMAAICHACPVCEYGRRHPGSVIGRVLRHPWHAERCPFWKAERERYGVPAAGVADATSKE